jgi:hypothetical protein
MYREDSDRRRKRRVQRWASRRLRPNSNLRKLHKRSKSEEGKDREKRERKRFSKTILKNLSFVPKLFLGWLVLINIRKGEEGLLNHKRKNKIEFIPNNFRFDKNMQGCRCMLMYDVTMTRKRK